MSVRRARLTLVEAVRINQCQGLGKRGRALVMIADDYVEAGGLVAYAPDLTVQFRRAADYVDKILKGARPSELPIEQPTTWTLVVNLKVARTLKLRMPESILLRADEVLQ